MISSISLPLLGEESSRTLRQKAELDAPEIKMGDSVSQVRKKAGRPRGVSSPYGKKPTFILMGVSALRRERLYASQRVLMKSCEKNTSMGYVKLNGEWQKKNVLPSNV